MARSLTLAYSPWMNAPPFAEEDWYRQPNDHRCPHDAWLNRCEILEAASGARDEKRSTRIVVELLGAYHDGVIRFSYLDVKRYSLSSPDVSAGLGDWLSDDFQRSDDDVWTHRIIWAGGQWAIEAREITYEWIPRNEQP